MLPNGQLLLAIGIAGVDIAKVEECSICDGSSAFGPCCALLCPAVPCCAKSLTFQNAPRSTSLL